MQEFFEIYKGYKLLCTPMLMEDGRFSAQLTIQQDLRYELREIPIGVQPSVFSTEAEAANAARLAGRQWVDDQ